jgi:hypothetical protein
MNAENPKMLKLFKLQVVGNIIVLIFLFFYFNADKQNKLNANEYQLAMLEQYGELTFITCTRKEEEDKKFQIAIRENDNTAYQSIKNFYSFSNDPDDGFFYTFLMAIRNNNSSAFNDLSYYLEGHKYDQFEKAKEWAILFEMMGEFYSKANLEEIRSAEVENKKVMISKQLIKILN